MNNAVGKHIGKLRRELGLSQEQLAEKLSVTRQAVSNWETGRTSREEPWRSIWAGASMWVPVWETRVSRVSR